MRFEWIHLNYFYTGNTAEILKRNIKAVRGIDFSFVVPASK